MKPSDWITKAMTMVANTPLDAQWRIVAGALAVFCVAGLLALLPDLAELPCTARALRALVPVIKVMRLLAGRRPDWRALLLNLLG